MTNGTERAPYGREEGRRRKREQTPLPTYYGLPAVKSSHYGWLVVTYFWIGGLAGAAQVLATIADLLGGRRDRSLVRAGRYIALLGAVASPALLIADLHTPKRFFNMLRIFRPTSAMSIGSWTLFAFGNFSGVTAVGQLLDDLFGLALGGKVSRWAAVPAALTGLVMTCYTGVLLTATSTPTWAAASWRIPALFATTAMSTASAALSLWLNLTGAPRATRQRLEALALLCAAVQYMLVRLLHYRWQERGLDTVPERPRLKLTNRLGVQGIGIALPSVIHTLHLTTGRHSRATSALAALAVLAGGYIERAYVLTVGNESAKRPEDYFAVTQSEALTVPEPADRYATPASELAGSARASLPPSGVVGSLGGHGLGSITKPAEGQA